MRDSCSEAAAVARHCYKMHRMCQRVLQLVLLYTAVTTVTLPLANSQSQYEYGYNTNPKRYTRTIQLKQGQLQGVISDPRVKHALPAVEQYLGIPYAAPPVGDLRFMPPGSAPPWYGTKIADKFGPVCPQKFPNKNNMGKDRKEYFERLAQHLNESDEDCLYLNIYAPVQVESSRIARKYPVMIFLHGESFEWNSGNPYDGSVLAAYGHVIVVTLNYRLGVLGFLKAGLDDQTRSNFGLVDQVAALLWVQQNIGAFGGDPSAVTLMGHGTGAACAGLLMLSPMVEQDGSRLLFQRAILMSGSALADWALAEIPSRVTYQIAAALNCPMDDATWAACLRKKRIEDIINAAVVVPAYRTRLGPIVDGSVVPNDPKQLMTVYNGLFKRFEIMYGLTEIESADLLGPVGLTYGLLEKERDQELRQYMQTRCEMRLGLCLARTLAEYTGIHEEYIEDQPSGMFPNSRQELDRATVARDTLLDILSDARTAAPVVQTAKYHAAANPRSYFYVFGHTTSSKKALRDKSVNGDELPYVFGVPVDGPKFHFTDYYTARESLFSEAIMTFWTNFAHTGNPNAPRRNAYYTLGPLDWQQYEIDWPEYDLQNEQYLYLSITPRIQQYYRQKEMRYWNEILPDLLKNHTSVPYAEKLPLPTKPKTIPPWVYPKPSGIGRELGAARTPRPTYYGIVKNKPDTATNPVRKIELDTTNNMMGNMQYGIQVTAEPEPTQSASSPMNIIIVIGVLILLVNLFAFIAIYVTRIRKRKRENKFKNTYNSDNMVPVDEVEDKPSKFDEGEANRGCSLIKMIGKSSRSEDTYEAVVKPGEEPEASRFKLTRQVSSSTIDPHTKVRDWITNEIVQRYSPRFLRRTRQQLFMEHKLNQQQQKTTEIKKEKEGETVGSNSTLGQSPTRPVSPVDKVAAAAERSECSQKQTPSGIQKPSAKKPEKVSVAIDATPAGRGSSVLRQEPIEITKSLDCPRVHPDSSDSPPPLRRSVTLDDCTDASRRNDLLRTNSINLTTFQPEESTIVRIEHHHSRSDPVQDTLKSPLYAYSTPVVPLKLKTFNKTHSEEVNVTSRDEVPEHSANRLTPEDALMTIKRRNFPKVLPDFPNETAAKAYKRRSMPVPGALFLPIPEVASGSRPNSPDGHKVYSRVPPAPPPRVSTLPRNAAAALCHSSPATVATEPPPTTRSEPEITCVNNLFVGPLSTSATRHHQGQSNSDSCKLNTQQIYDNLRSAAQRQPATEQKAEHKTPKTIITTDPNQPIKRVEPKVIIKPTITRKNNDANKNKGIPRVVAQDVVKAETNPVFARQASFESKDTSTSTTELSKTGKADSGPSKLTSAAVQAAPAAVKPKLQKASQIPTFTKNSLTSLNKENSSSESSPSEESDTGTVVKRIIE